MVSAESRSDRPIAQASLMYARYVYVWVICCSSCYSDSFVSLLGKPWSVCLQHAAWQIVSSSAGLYVLHLDSPEWPIAWPPSRSRQGHSRFWCYSESCPQPSLLMMALLQLVLLMQSPTERQSNKSTLKWIIEQFHLVPDKGQWWPTAMNVTIGLASHWLPITDLVLYSTDGAICYAKETAYTP